MAYQLPPPIDCNFESKDAIGRALSNLTPYPFEYGGYDFASMEGFLQSIKTPDLILQEEIRGLSGYAAYERGQDLDSWKDTQLLYFGIIPYGRSSMDYNLLLFAAYNACMMANSTFREALKESGFAGLLHADLTDRSDTTLTADEYIAFLYQLRLNV